MEQKYERNANLPIFAEANKKTRMRSIEIHHMLPCKVFPILAAWKAFALMNTMGDVRLPVKRRGLILIRSSSWILGGRSVDVQNKLFKQKAQTKKKLFPAQSFVDLFLLTVFFSIFQSEI
jgi:hypothetical protein